MSYLSLEKKYSIAQVTVNVRRAPLFFPFRIATGQHNELKNVFISIRLRNGFTGYGEAPIAEHITGETAYRTKKNLERSVRFLDEQSIFDYTRLSGVSRMHIKNNPAAWAAIDMALLDGLTRAMDMPLWKLFGPTPTPIKTDITLVIDSLENTLALAHQFYRRGFRTFKIKIEHDIDTAAQRIIAVCNSHRNIAIIIDANQALTGMQARRLLAVLRKYAIIPILFEQPVAHDDWDGLRLITRHEKVPVCADESVRTMNDLAYGIKTKAFRALNIKFTKYGILPAIDMARFAKANGLQLMMGSMMESPLSVMAAAHIASGLGFFDYIDLDTPYFIKGPFGENRYQSPSGRYMVHRVPSGIGITVS